MRSIQTFPLQFYGGHLNVGMITYSHISAVQSHGLILSNYRGIIFCRTVTSVSHYPQKKKKRNTGSPRPGIESMYCGSGGVIEAGTVSRPFIQTASWARSAAARHESCVPCMGRGPWPGDLVPGQCVPGFPSLFVVVADASGEEVRRPSSRSAARPSAAAIGGEGHLRGTLAVRRAFSRRPPRNAAGAASGGQRTARTFAPTSCSLLTGRGGRSPPTCSNGACLTVSQILDKLALEAGITCIVRYSQRECS